jgi:phytoene desaturase
MPKKIIIVGAGPGGLSSAMILGKRGFDVSVYEENNYPGGRNGAIREQGYTFDLGPTFLMMKFILDEIFTEAGRNSDDYLKFTRLDPMYRLSFEDMDLNIYDDKNKLKQELSKYFPKAAEGFDKFFNKESERFPYIFACIQKDYGKFKEFFTPTFLKAIPHIPFFGSIYDYLGKYFSEHKLRLSFSFQSKYLGMSAWECPALFITIPFMEHAFGIYHVEKGLAEISIAMEKVAKEHGVKFYYKQPVKQILIKDKKVIGIELESGEKQFADEVIVNADFGYVVNNLLPADKLKKWSPKKLAKKEFSCSAFMMYLGLNGEYKQIAHHTIIFAKNYRQNMNDIFKNKKLPSEISFYLRNASITDKTLAPEGKSNIYVLVPVPNNQANIDWSIAKQQMRELTLDSIEQRLGIKDIRKKIDFERIITPADWENKANVYLGATFNLSHIPSQMLYFRPHNHFDDLDMYLVGGGTHPGSGLPIIYESGRIVANLISKKYKVPFTPPTSLQEKLLQKN